MQRLKCLWPLNLKAQGVSILALSVYICCKDKLFPQLPRQYLKKFNYITDNVQILENVSELAKITTKLN